MRRERYAVPEGLREAYPSAGRPPYLCGGLRLAESVGELLEGTLPAGAEGAYAQQARLGHIRLEVLTIRAVLGYALIFVIPAEFLRVGKARIGTGQAGKVQL